MDKGARQCKTANIYENADAIRGKITMEIEDSNTTRIQPPEHTGSDCVKIRNYRAAVVCLVLLCFLLVTAVIVLCVTLTQERQQLISKNENLTNERDQLILKNTKLTNERDRMTLKNTNLTSERNQLNLKNTNLTNQRHQLRNELQILDGWTYYQFSFYYMSNVTKNWDESRQDCLKRGADLIIINNREEQDFVHNMSGPGLVYIGLTDIDVEGTWKWVDNSNIASGLWGSGEPSGGRRENCAANLAIPPLGGPVGWNAVPCNDLYRWICEKRISQLILA